MTEAGPSPPPGRQRALTLLSLALVCSMATWFSASAVIPQLRADWGLSRSAASWLTIAVQLGFVAGALASSAVNLADVVSPRVVIFAGSLGAAGANGLLVLAHGPAAAIPLRFATGFFLAGVYPPALKLVSTWFRQGRGMALGIVVGALTLGSASPHLVNGLGGLGWKSVIATTSILTVVGGTVGLIAVPEGPFPFPRGVIDPSQLRAVFANRGVRLSSIGYFGHMWELYAMWAWFFAFASESVFASRHAAALTTFAVIGVGALGSYVGGVLGDRFGRAETTAGLMVCSGLCALTIGVLPSWGAVVVGLVWGFTVVADSAQFSTLVTEYADQAYVATALGVQLAIGFTLTVATIWLIPIARDEIGWRWAFAVLAAGPALGVLAMARLRGTASAG